MSFAKLVAAICSLGSAITFLLSVGSAQAQNAGFAKLHERWVGGGLIGADNEVAAARQVTITEHASGYSIYIANQFGFTCTLTASSSGNPKELSDCVSKSNPDWRVFAPVELLCRPNGAEYLCEGPIHLGTVDFPPDAPNWTMRIAARR